MIGFVIAMENEADVLLRHMEVLSETVVCEKKLYVGNAYGKKIALLISGVGKVNAACGAQLLFDRYPLSALVNFGLAGGLNGSLAVGGVYGISRAAEYDFDLAELNGTTVGTLNEYAEPFLPLSSLSCLGEGKALGTGDRFNDSEEDYRFLTKTLKADIRDMEGGAIVHACAHMKLPVYSFKGISDLAGSGSTIEQYKENTEKALAALETALPSVIDAL